MPGNECNAFPRQSVKGDEWRKVKKTSHHSDNSFSGKCVVSRQYRLNTNVAETERIKLVSEKRYRVAVTSKTRTMIDVQYGNVKEFHIYEVCDKDFFFVETRKAPRFFYDPTDCGEKKEAKQFLIRTIGDCDAVLTKRIGCNAKQYLLEHKIVIVEFDGMIREGLFLAFQHIDSTKEIAQAEMQRA